MRVLVLVVVLCSLHAVRGRSSGPPAGESANEDLVCREMTPNPGAHGDPQSGDGGYRLNISPEMSQTATGFSYESDTVYQITLSGDTFRGFLVHARVPGNDPGNNVTPMLLGSFTPGSGQATLNCDLDAGAASTAAIGHSGRALSDVTSVQFNWTAPSTSGEVDFYYTVVHMRTMHYDAINASTVGVIGPPTAPTTLGTTGSRSTSTTDPNPSTIDPGSLNTPSRNPEDYRLQVLSPEGCVRSECDLFIGIDTNTGDSGFLDIYMEGTAEGWLAVGFSDTADMFGADVVSCVRNPTTDVVIAWDGWNPQSRASDVDTIQDVRLFRGSYEDNRISCSVTKKIAPSDTQDLVLNQELYIIYARRVSANTNPASLSTHFEGSTMVRGISDQRYIPATFSSFVTTTIDTTTSSASVPSLYLGVTVPLLLAAVVMIALP